MHRHRVLSAVLALILVGAIGVVLYLESGSAGSAATATTSIVTTTSTTTTTSTLPPTTLPPTTSSTVPTTTIAPTTTVPPTTLPPTTTLPPPERALVPVVVSSGPSDGQRLAPGAQLIAAVGWTDIRPLTGSSPLTETVVFFAEGMQASAELLAADTGLAITSIAPLAEAPPVAGLANAELIFYLGGT